MLLIMLYSLRALFCLFVTIIPFSVAHAAPLKRVQEWRETSIEAPNGAFQYCYIEAPYQNKDSLIFALKSDGSLNIGLGRPNANLPKNGKVTATITIDQKKPLTLTGQNLSPELFVLQAGQNYALYRDLMRGYRLHLKTDTGVDHTYQLSKTSEALSYLIDCVDDNLKQDQNKILQNVIKEDKLPPALVQILYHAGLKSFTPVDLSQIPADKRMADFAWTYGPALGGLQEGKVTQGLDHFDDFMTQYQNGLTKLCAGKFSTTLGNVKDLSVMKIQKFNAKCERPDANSAISGVLYQTQTNVLTLIYHEVPFKARDLAQQISDRIFNVLVKAIEEGLSRQKETQAKTQK